MKLVQVESINKTNEIISVNNLKTSIKSPAFTLTNGGQKGTAEKS